MCCLSAPRAVYLPSNHLAVLAWRTWDKASRSVWVAASLSVVGVCPLCQQPFGVSFCFSFGCFLWSFIRCVLLGVQ